MKNHFNIIKLEQFANGKYPAKKTFEISKHLSECAECRTNLQNIAPTFFITPFAEIAEMMAVKNEKHFSEDEINSFIKAELPIAYRLKMSEHLRKCIDCKSKLYKKDPAILKQTISSILGKEEKVENKSFFNKLSLPITIGATAISLIGLLFFIIFTANKTNDSAFQTKVSDQENIQPPTVNKSETDSNIFVGVENLNSQKVRNTNQPSPKNKNIAKKQIVVTKEKDNSETDKNKSISNAKNVIISNSRSSNNSSDCEKNNLISAITPYFETITERQPTFRWKSVPNVVKYHLYISDNDQILIEEFETEKETSYKLKSLLELDKTYKWKILATLADGKTVNSESITFSAGKTAQKYIHKKEVRKTINPIRCIQ
jgi:hypothetical protein